MMRRVMTRFLPRAGTGEDQSGLRSCVMFGRLEAGEELVCASLHHRLRRARALGDRALVLTREEPARLRIARALAAAGGMQVRGCVLRIHRRSILADRTTPVLAPIDVLASSRKRLDEHRGASDPCIRRFTSRYGEAPRGFARNAGRRETVAAHGRRLTVLEVIACSAPSLYFAGLTCGLCAATWSAHPIAAQSPAIAQAALAQDPGSGRGQTRGFRRQRLERKAQAPEGQRHREPSRSAAWKRCAGSREDAPAPSATSSWRASLRSRHDLAKA